MLQNLSVNLYSDLIIFTKSSDSDKAVFMDSIAYMHRTF